MMRSDCVDGRGDEMQCDVVMRLNGMRRVFISRSLSAVKDDLVAPLTSS